MFSLSLAPGSLLFYLFLIYAFAFVVLNCFHWFIYIRISLYKENLVSKKREGLSVVICARNEYVNLKENLPAILEQDYPEFEVIVVNHSSDDDSNDLLTDLTDRFPNLKIIEIKENLNFFSGKKFPLSIGIKSATYDRIVFTDADCRPTSRNWLSCMDSSFNDSTKIILGYGAYE